MRLLFTSDLHGLDSAFVDFSRILKERKYDVGVLGGDLMGYPSEEDLQVAARDLGHSKQAARNHGEAVQRALLNKQEYYKGLLRDSGKPIVFVMGNDDGILGSGLAWTSEAKVVNIHQRKAKWGPYNFVGYQYTTPFVGGTFEKCESDQDEDFRMLENLIDANTVLVTHGPAWGTLDTVSDGKQIGSQALRRLIDRKPPRLHLHGHIHRMFGVEGNVINGSYPHSRKFVSIAVDTMEVGFVR